MVVGHVVRAICSSSKLSPYIYLWRGIISPQGISKLNKRINTLLLRSGTSTTLLPTLYRLLLIQLFSPERSIANPQIAHHAMVHHGQDHVAVAVTQPHVQHTVHFLAAGRVERGAFEESRQLCKSWDCGLCGCAYNCDLEVWWRRSGFLNCG